MKSKAYERLLVLDDMNDDADDCLDASLLIVIDALFNDNQRMRRIKWRNDRIDWNDHVRRLLHCNQFDSKYHMPLDSFQKLVNLLRDDITVDFTKSMNSTSGNIPIFPEMIVGCGLRYLGGEHVKSIEDIFGLDDSSVPRVIDMFFDAVLSCPALQIKLPTDTQALEALAKGFATKSTSDGLINGCVGAIDGWLCCTIQPIDRDIHNKRDYFSGHYQCFGLNVQAICDHQLRFIYFAVAAPGSTNDARALNKCIHLCQWIDGLEGSPFFLVGDNAYTGKDQLLVPFSGSNITEAQRTYNFFLSQVRIRIEMAFGRLTTKWRIFRCNLENGTRRNSMICRVAAVLHNFVINETGDMNETADDFIDSDPRNGSSNDSARSNLGYTPTIDQEQTVVMQEGSSLRRSAFVRLIIRDGLVRPSYNIERNS